MALRRRKPVDILTTALEAQGIDVPYKDGRIDSKKLLEFAEDSVGLDNSDSSLKYHERVSLVANELDLNEMEDAPAEAPAPAAQQQLLPLQQQQQQLLLLRRRRWHRYRPRQRQLLPRRSPAFCRRHSSAWRLPTKNVWASCSRQTSATV